MYRGLMVYGAAAMMGIIVALIVSGIFTVVTVTGSGMEPAMENGSKVLVNRLAYCGKSPTVPSVGSVVVFESEVYGEEGEGNVLVRRVAAVEGDTVEIRDSIFYRNGKPYDEYMNESVHMEDMRRMVLGYGEIFVMNDNRKSSMDSRNEAIGILKTEECMGKVCFQ